MNNQGFFRTLRQALAMVLVGSATLLIGCTGTEDPQPSGTGTTGPGSTTTTPGSGTTTTPGSGTTTTPGSGTTTTPGTVVASVDYIKAKGNLTFLAAAIAQAGLTADLNKANITILAPSDDAFKAAGFASVAAVSAAPAADLRRILQYHVIGSRIDLSSIPTVPTYYQTTLSDSRVYVTKVSNSDVSFNESKVIEGDIPTTGSTIHIINKILTPPSRSSSDVAKANADLSIFYAAVDKAGTAVQNLLTQSTETGITVFAPNNAAFKAAGYADEAAVRAVSADTLANLLSYHILKYRAFSQTFQNGADVVTAQGTSVRTNVSNGKVTILGKGNGTNVANVVQADQISTNGVVHVIDRVLLPK
ncbi:hypothetical protein GCM10027341_39280 [Spirosoma knui]